ncbi:hypothetical protein TREMEDRAFT_70708 [Tremella mesenterica DSM 1558]|uniref:uncharacterized protein n=1 Tax=Tremella mesenterica (strain ATCC 24925 / CBS 8224 / DSM 1558 / NBRC 9311 / NRRL Y-6157 / RJB 2259-6 / UBC 559-6) TaxID=578456 RepID=UPI0003F49F1B|nr:uncharacterized protein TREMEDRAFT_70708 [Tremella mesenterica DSM 1558]EIW72386.1 hypothetical protein TREMEDRAFT_70708 [Tremella mesenterica DSM 1558]
MPVNPPQPDSASDMSLDSSSSSASSSSFESEEEHENDTVQVSLSGSGAWDDRELVRMYDAAMEEFHLHHPGPGSWLDKATAALALGKPLPGVKEDHLEWYTPTSQSKVQAVEKNSLPSAKRQKTSKPKTKPNGLIQPTTNPYAPAPESNIQPITSNNIPRQRRSSPTYMPQSPPPNPGLLVEDEEERDLYQEPQIRPDVEWDHIPPQIPTYGVESTEGISVEDAMGYALAAQYWAGYWMGVAKTKQNNIPAPPVSGEKASNVFTTRRQFGVMPEQNLRR